MQRKTLIKMMIILVVIIIFIWYPGVLEGSIPGLDLPLGSLISAIGLVVWSLFFGDFGSWHKSGEKDIRYLLLRNLSRLSVLLAFSWFFISWAMSGNLAFQFTDDQSTFETWWDFTVLVLMGPPLIYIADKFWTLVIQIRSHY
jgi:hypothetical protein